MARGIHVSIAITAADALDLARQINFYLSRTKDLQEKYPSAPYDGDKDWEMVLRMLKSISVSDQVTISIIPDQRTPGSSGYGYFSTPRDDQYLPKK